MELKFDEHHCYRFDEASHITLNSELYKAMDLGLSRDVALKKVKIHGNSPREIQGNYRRALQEVKTMVQISELTAKVPNIYSYYFNEAQGILYIIMQWISGETLAQRMKRHIPDTVFLRWMEEIGNILTVMGKKNFQHKDIKPDNIMFNFGDDLYLIDFNISVSVPNPLEGTLYYKPPEMDFGSVTVDRSRSDMFSIGVMLFQQVTGHLPQRMIDYDCYDPEKEKWDIFREPREFNPSVSNALNDLIVRLMRYNPRERYASYSAMVNDMKRVEKELRFEGRKKQR